MESRMKRWAGVSLLVLLATSAGITFDRHCPGCIDRGRVNKSCEWTDDMVFPIDVNNPTHRRHLIADAQLAEDLATRRADAEFNHLYGVEAHGGLVDSGRLRKECMANLMNVIQANHQVTEQQVQGVR